MNDDFRDILESPKAARKQKPQPQDEKPAEADSDAGEETSQPPESARTDFDDKDAASLLLSPRSEENASASRRGEAPAAPKKQILDMFAANDAADRELAPKSPKPDFDKFFAASGRASAAEGGSEAKAKRREGRRVEFDDDSWQLSPRREKKAASKAPAAPKKQILDMFAANDAADRELAPKSPKPDFDEFFSGCRSPVRDSSATAPGARVASSVDFAFAKDRGWDDVEQERAYLQSLDFGPYASAQH